MPSTALTWLDHDSKARERSLRVLALFKERSTRDELGLGAIRDNMAEALFPGTSTIQTRLRYMLFVPWAYCQIEDEFASGRLKAPQIADRLEALEYEIVEQLRDSDDQAGVFGRRAGKRLKRLPSSVYWAGLESWGIRIARRTQSQYHRTLPALVVRRKARAGTATEGDDVEIDASTLTWHPALPVAPEDFPRKVGLKLTSDEAMFLLDRVRQCHPDSLLAHLFEQCEPADCDFPWEHPDQAGFSAAQRELLYHAEKLAVAAEGAFIVYNLALSELQQAESRVEEWTSRFESWAGDAVGAGLDVWDLSRLWELLADAPYQISPGARRFMEQWLALANASRGNVSGLQGARKVREMVETRERMLKGVRSRFSNPKALEQWGGASGAARYSYRWPTVSRFHRDLNQAFSGGA